MYKYIITLSCLAVLVGCLATNDNMHGSAGKNAKLLKGTYNATLQTSQGAIKVKLYADKAPLAVTNFVEHAKAGYYDNLKFHRVMDDFMIQGGDPTGTGAGGNSIYGEPFADEDNDLKMDRGVLAMANRGSHTNGSQFFIVQKKDGTPWLQGKHTIFGEVVSGMEVVDAIAKVPVNGMDAPLEDITFTVDIQ